MLNQFFDRMDLPLPNKKISNYSDGNIQYATIVPKLYCETCVNYGQIIKVKENNRFVDLIRAKNIGKPAIESLSTSIVEGYNNKIRQIFSRFGRKTASFSKCTGGYIAAMNTFQFVHNFIDQKYHPQSPAMLESITDHL